LRKKSTFLEGKQISFREIIFPGKKWYSLQENGSFLQEIKNNSLKCNLPSGKHPIPSGTRKFVDKIRNSLQEK